MTSLSRKSIRPAVTIARADLVEPAVSRWNLALGAEFAERELAGRSIPVGLEAVEHHLSLCAECREDYEELLRVLTNREIPEHSY